MNSEYNNETVLTAIATMSDEKMFQLLEQLEQSEFWPAILRYSNIRISYAEGILRTADPVKDATSIARTQGSLAGLSDLNGAVIQLVLQRQQVNAEAAEKAEQSTDVE